MNTDIEGARMGQDPLAESFTIQEHASAEGFDWPDVSGVFEKIQEEIIEVQQAIENGDGAHARSELGDLLFATVNLARFLEGHPSEELCRANARFSKRFLLMKTEVERQGRAMKECSLSDLDVVWERVKKECRRDAKKGLT